MARKKWHIEREGDGLILARRAPVRFDVSATVTMPLLRKTRLAHQIRQDLWRALRRQPGFTPVVKVVQEGGALAITAGGTIENRPFHAGHVTAQIETVLNDPANRARWQRHARLVA